MMNPQNILKCKFCKWQTLRWVTNKNGKRINQSNELIAHVMREHSEEYEKILERTDDD